MAVGPRAAAELRVTRIAIAVTTLAVADKLGLYRPAMDPIRSDYQGWADAALTCPEETLPILVDSGLRPRSTSRSSRR